MNELPPGVAQFGKRILSFSPSPTGEITLQFEDESVASCDILVGCDGIKSTIRRQLYRALAKKDTRFSSFIEPYFTGTIAYRGLISSGQMPTSAEGGQHDALQRPMMVCTHIYIFNTQQLNTQ